MKVKNIKSNKKIPFLLLEVLIAFTLLILAILPLIYPHVLILTTEKKFIQRVELDHLVNLLYVDVLERLYKNAITWGQLESREPLEVDQAMLERVGLAKKLPYKGTYSFKELNHKPPEKGANTVYLFNIVFEFASTEKKDQKFSYKYTVFIVRKLKEGIELPAPKEEKI